MSARDRDEDEGLDESESSSANSEDVLAGKKRRGPDAHAETRNFASVFAEILGEKVRPLMRSDAIDAAWSRTRFRFALPAPAIAQCWRWWRGVWTWPRSMPHKRRSALHGQLLLLRVTDTFSFPFSIRDALHQCCSFDPHLIINRTPWPHD